MLQSIWNWFFDKVYVIMNNNIWLANSTFVCDCMLPENLAVYVQQGQCLELMYELLN